MVAIFVEEAPEAALGLALDLGQLVEGGELEVCGAGYGACDGGEAVLGFLEDGALFAVAHCGYQFDRLRSLGGIKNLGHSFVHDLLYEVACELVARGRVPLLTPHAATRMVRDLYLLLWKAFIDKQYHERLFRLAYEGSLFATRSVLALVWAVLEP